MIILERICLTDRVTLLLGLLPMMGHVIPKSVRGRMLSLTPCRKPDTRPPCLRALKLAAFLFKQGLNCFNSAIRP
jgi:hypothetical protein